MASNTFLQYGRTEPFPKSLILRAGPLTAIFEPHTAFLRYVRLGDHEVIRAIYGAIRDEHWATIPSDVRNLKSTINRDSFALSFDVYCRSHKVDYVWRAAITGETSGQITFTFEGESQSSFLRNRIGLCVLHPMVECAGKPCTIEHVDGVEERGAFPRNISPNQPFYGIRAIRHEIVTTGVMADIRFAGETFEMEDQRNWTEASFKTYSTPLSLPMPVEVRKGDRVSHSVKLTLQGYSKPVLPVLHGRPPQVSIATTPVLPLPPLGLSVARHGNALTVKELARLRALKLSHLRVDLDLSSQEYPQQLQRAASEAEQLGAGLHVALSLSENPIEELRSLQPHLPGLKSKVLLWLTLPKDDGATDPKLIRLVQTAIQQQAPGALLGAGTRLFFADVNRGRYADADRPFLCYSINPQVHQPDLVTVAENVGAQAITVETAREITSKPVVISPISLKSPHNPEMTLTLPGKSILPGDVDVRQMSLFCAGWTLGSIARLAATGNVHSLTYFETTGWYGIMETEAGSPLPDAFPSQPGAVFPVYHLLADIGEFPGRQLFPSHSSHPLVVEAMTLFDGQRRKRLMVASYSPERLEVKIKTGTCRGRVRYLDETNALDAMNKPEQFRTIAGTAVESSGGKIELHLLPFALARIDID